VTVALLFGGQGTELPGMGLALARHLPAADALLRLAGDLAGLDAHHALEHGSPALARTAVIQPLLTAVGLGVWAALADNGITPSHVAGHSLGEVAAWSVVGAFSSQAAIELAAARGRLMEREATLHPGGMAAIAGTEESVLEHVSAVQAAGSLVVAAHNAPTAWTLSGVAPALAAIAARTATSPLPVAGAWHSPAMAGAVEEVRAAVHAAIVARTTVVGARTGVVVATTAVAVALPRVEVVTNRTGAIADPGDDVTSLLAEQLVRPVQWARTLGALAAAGVDHYIVAGPGKLMRSLVQKNVGARARVSIVETMDDLRELGR
jgi:[acyl-carrier-protein] S-malonyltransferase